MTDQIPMGMLAGDYERCAHMLDDALQRIADLEADNARLRAALEAIDTNLNVWSPHPAGSVQATMRDIARRALEGKDE